MSEVEAQEVSKKRQAEEPVEAEAPAAKKAKTAMDLFREQLEYYFSIANYPTDKWMNLTAAENDGFIPIATFSKFPRLAALLEGQEADFAVNAIKASDELALNEAGDAVKRKNPLPEDIDLESRSVFVSKLPIDASVTTLDAVKEYFQGFAPVLSVRVNKQRADKNVPCGTAYVTFAEVADKEKVLAMGSWTFGGAELKVKDKAAADAAFREEKAAKQAKRENGGDGDASAAPSAPVWERGLIVKLSSYGTPTLDELKTKFGEYGVVKFVDVPMKDDPEASTKPCFVRFAEADKAKAALDAIAAKSVQFGESVAEGVLLEGDEEEEYWVKNIISGKPNNNKRSGGRRGGRGGGRGGKRR